jgi:hypothetical protein
MASSVIPRRNAPDQDFQMRDAVRNEEIHRVEQD